MVSMREVYSSASAPAGRIESIRSFTQNSDGSVQIHAGSYKKSGFETGEVSYVLMLRSRLRMEISEFEMLKILTID